MNPIEIIGAVIGLLYLAAEVKASKSLWVLGILMPIAYAYIYFTTGLFANAGINVYYIGASVYGLLAWSSKKTSQKDSDAIKSFPRKGILPLAAIVIVLTGLLALLLMQLKESQLPLLDGFTAALNIVGMWMLAKKYYQQWIVWIVSDPFTIILCALTGLWASAIMYGVYLVISIYGYYRWKMNCDSE